MSREELKKEVLEKYAINELERLHEEAKGKAFEEYAHEDADACLCNLLVSLGFDKVVEVYNNIPKWYS